MAIHTKLLSNVTKPKVDKVFASVNCVDGKTRNLGRIDRKWWAPRAWYYRFVTFPRLKRNYERGDYDGIQRDSS
jgi:hypothetical protein